MVNNFHKIIILNVYIIISKNTKTQNMHHSFTCFHSVISHLNTENEKKKTNSHIKTHQRSLFGGKITVC